MGGGWQVANMCLDCHCREPHTQHMERMNSAANPPVLLLDEGFKLVVDDVLSLLDASPSAVDVLSVLCKSITGALVQVKVTSLINQVKPPLSHLALIVQVYLSSCFKGCQADHTCHEAAEYLSRQFGKWHLLA